MTFFVMKKSSILWKWLSTSCRCHFHAGRV